MIQEVRLPEISENVESGDVSNILVSIGESVEQDQPLMEVETEKAVVEIPSPAAGTVKEILVQVGSTVKIGGLMMKIESSAAGESEQDSSPGESEPAERQTAESKKEEAKTPQPDTPEDQQQKPPSPRTRQVPEPTQMLLDDPPPAAPSVRRFARELGVEIRDVRGSGARGRISMDDVKRHTKKQLQEGGGGGPKIRPLPDFSRFGEIEVERMSKVRQVTAQSMQQSWSTIPHVTQFEAADITSVEQFRDKYAREVERSGGKLTPTVILIKVLALALREFPRFNASIDMLNNEIVYKRFINIGIAADTPRGLLVPVLRDPDKKSLTEISIELRDIVSRARDGKLKPEEMEGATFSLSNQGVIGGDQFTPLIPEHQPAILGVSRTRTEPVWVDGDWHPRSKLPLALSYDHRLNDGADAARFLHWIVETLAEPFVLFL